MSHAGLAFTHVSCSLDRILDSMTTHRQKIFTDKCYVPGSYFLSRTTWFVEGINDPKYLYDGTGTYPMQCSIVGQVSSKGVYVDNHGNYLSDSPLRSPKLSDALFEFKLKSPEGPINGIYKPDFFEGVRRLKMLYNVMPGSDGEYDPFIIEEDGSVALRFTRDAFERTCTLDGRHPYYGLNVPLFDYPIRTDLEDALTTIRNTHGGRGDNVWTSTCERVPNGERSEYLKDRLVRVYFSVRYCPDIGLIGHYNTVSSFN